MIARALLMVVVASLLGCRSPHVRKLATYEAPATMTDEELVEALNHDELLPSARPED